ncbi:hypothetical protein B0H14DRAFT_3891983 [Mycena olivaceomarginata]|nr:hypothetical protein B0H14DRAFT_3891983 [Mycena olivaceomarginata]
MSDAAPTTASASRAAYAHLAREFLITVALSFCCLLALLHTVQTMTLCTLLAFIAMEPLARAAGRLGWAPSTRTDDAEMGVEDGERGTGENRSYEKVEPKPRPDALEASEQRVKRELCISVSCGRAPMALLVLLGFSEGKV